jgi:N4-gp56 family major capsid protein
MANTEYGVNDAEAVKLWSRKTMHEALKMAFTGRFCGTDSNSLCQIKDDLSKNEGDRIRSILRMQLTGAGQQGDNTLEGNEEALVTHTDNINIDQLRHAVRSGGKMSEQRVPFSVREEARMGLQDWWADRFDTWFFNQISGNAAQSDTRFTGNQAATSPDSAHRIMAGVATAESNLSANASQTFTLSLIDEAVLAARTLTPVIRPLNNQQEPGKHQFVMFLSPEQHFDLRRSTATAEWQDIQKQVLAGGGDVNKNPIFSGALGVYNGTILHETFRLPLITTGTGANTGNRAIFCGAQTACLAFGRGYSKNRMSWTEELFDYGNQLGVSSGCIAGLKKSIYNSRDFATIAVSTAHSAAATAAAQR